MFLCLGIMYHIHDISKHNKDDDDEHRTILGAFYPIRIEGRTEDQKYITFMFVSRGKERGNPNISNTMEN